MKHLNTPILKNPILQGSLFLALVLGGCTSANEGFDCPAGKGKGCISVSQVNLETNDEEEGSKHFPLPIINSMPQLSINVEGLRGVQRVQEEQVKVWIAPFQDDQGNLHESSVIYTVVRPGYWQLSDLIER